jgi:hypothetical protein
VDRSLRHLGQLLVVMGALLGAALGIALALVVGNATTSGAVLASGPARAAVLAAGPSSSRPPVSRGAGAQGSAVDNGASGPQRGEADGQADDSGGKAGKSKELRHDDPGKSKDKAKSKDKSK